MKFFTPASADAGNYQRLARQQTGAAKNMRQIHSGLMLNSSSCVIFAGGNVEVLQ